MRVLILTDGKAGDVMPCRGVAAQMTIPDQIEERVVEYHPWHALPFARPTVPRDAAIFDLVIASGRRAAPLLCSIARMTNGPFTLFLKVPPLGHRSMDLIWAPTHDGFEAANAIATDAGPHPLDANALEAERDTAAQRFAAYENPIGVLLGGDSASVTWTTETARIFANQLQTLAAGRPCLIAPSRRTPPVLRDAMAQIDGWLWDGESDNPYRQILAHCDTLVVTGDSHNMVSEAVDVAPRVHVFRPPGLAPKFQRFLDHLDAAGHIRALDDTRPFSSARPVPAAKVIGDETRRLMDSRRTAS